MSEDAPALNFDAEISPEFNQFVLGTGDVLRIAEQLGRQASSSPESLGVTAPEGALFRLAPGVVELSITGEVWTQTPTSTVSPHLDRLVFRLEPSGTSLQLASITPSPADVTVELPEVRPYTVEVLVLDRQTRHDDDFDISVRTERWLIRLW
jgi:hypothetical protein